MVTAQSITIRFVKNNFIIISLWFLSGLAGSFLNVFIPVSIGKFYELVLHTNSAKGKLFETIGIQLQSLDSFFIFFLLIIILRSLFLFLQQFLTSLVNETFTRDLREMMFEHQLRQTLSSFRTKPAGDYILRYSGDMSSVQKLIGNGIISFASDLFFLIIALTLLSFIQLKVTLVIKIGRAHV